ncbi:MAG: hypothetical protein K0U15_01715 [Proteobacteria bacterium]|nr:hypothetical protein [Pseudomonadota bacterium]MCH9758909.1 hypothetical protein [Pseudomonadota bacterium]
MNTRTLIRTTINIYAILGVLAVIAVVVGFARDFAAFDQTKGGYEPPYKEYTGTPINWDAGDRSSNGFVQRGRIINTLLNCTTGMISFQIYGNIIDFRQVSERAIAVHKPREACERSGFNPEF